MNRVDVAVIGGGAMGSAAAWSLARSGRSAVLFEQFEPGHTKGSSHGGSRIFRLQYADPLYVRLAQQALSAWRGLEDDAGEPLLDTTGGIDHGDPAGVQAVADAMAACGVPHSWLRPEEAAERWPAMRFSGDVLHQADGGRCRADATVAALQRRAGELGAEVRHGAAATVTEIGGSSVRVTCADETWTADTVVVAAGAWASSVLAGHVGGLPPLAVTQQQIAHFTPTDPTVEWPSFLHHRDPFIYGLLTPAEGVKVAEHHEGTVLERPEDRTFRPDPGRRDRVVRYVEEHFPGLDPAPVHEATCLYTSTANQDFVIDRVGPVVVASPCSGHGFKFVPAIGELLAGLATGTTDPASLPRRWRL